MNRDQRKHVGERLRELYTEKRSNIWNESPMPASVKRAESIVEQWKAADRKRRRASMQKLDSAYAQAREALLFDDAGKAIDELRKFEKFKV